MRITRKEMLALCKKWGGIGKLGGKSPATSAHMSQLLRLLPSGSDRVHKISLREDQRLTIEERVLCLWMQTFAMA